MTSCIKDTVDICQSFAKQFLPGTLSKEERIIAGVLGGVGIITTIALAILGAAPVALGITGVIAGTIVVGAVLGSRGISYTGLVVAGAFAFAGTALGHVPLLLVFTI